MALKEQIQDDMKAAMLSGNRFVGDVLRDLKAAILNEEVATGKRDEGLSDEEVEKVIAREVKKRSESIRLYRDNDREELAAAEEKESQVLEKYLPKQLDEAELLGVIDSVIDEIKPEGMRDMGRVIGAVKSKVGNSADGATISQIVKQKLQ